VEKGIKVELERLKQRQQLPLEVKEGYTAKRIIDWYNHFTGNVCVSFSGGKDSTVLLHIVRKLYPNVPAVFVDTGLEYPEVRDFVKTVENVVWLRPKMAFSQVLDKYGYPIVSKKVAMMIHALQNETEKNKNTCNLYRTGINKNGKLCMAWKLPLKWHSLVKAPFKISDRCCYVLKKEALISYQKKTGSKPFVGTMASDSKRRELSYLIGGCNPYHSKLNAISIPMAFWMEEDVWAYIRKYNLPYSKIYDSGVKRTGCVFCMFGSHLESEPNKFQILKTSHPKLYDYCINKLNLKQCLDYINVKY
jgi:3'-phosphoadenosine 5'-phosphosulfate sulfotransferase (PAPS reductase)/FAD synthetase